MGTKRPHMGNLRKKILLSLLFFAVIPIFAITALLIYPLRGNIINTRSDHLSTRLSAAAQEIDAKCSTYLNRSLLIADNNYCLSVLGDVVRNNYTSLLDLRSLLFSLTIDLIPPYSSNIELTFYLDGYNFQSSVYVESISGFPDKALMNRILQSGSREVIWAEAPFTDNNGRSYLVFYRHVASFTRDAIIRVGIPYSDIEAILNRFCAENPNCVILHRTAASEMMFYKDGGGKIVSAADFHPDSYYLIHGIALADGSTLTVYIERRQVLREYISFFALAFLLIMVVIALVFAASSLTTTKITKDLNSFITTIALYESGSSLESIRPSGVTQPYNEIEIIKERFTRVLQEQELAYQSLQDEKNKNNLLEISLLQSRLNPHMLYNSLSSIRMCAEGNDNSKTTAIVDALTSYYRLALNKGLDIILVRQEIDLVTQYVNIISLTYSRRCRLTVTIGADIMNKRILKHLIQPIVENSLHHGLRGLPGDAMIEIGGWQSGEFLIFQIRDNGFGMDEELIQKVGGLEYESPRGGFGIKSLAQKISLCYGSGCGIELQNNPSGGLTVTITVREL